MSPIISHYQTAAWLSVRSKIDDNQSTVSITTSLDLNYSSTRITLTAEGAVLPADQTVPWTAVQEVADDENGCYLVEDGRVQRVKFFSAQLQRAYSLFPTQTAPTMLVSGITMHRIVDCDPHQDTQNKFKALGRRPRGDVLDTSMGLGYTAIEAARTAATVITCEIDPTVEQVCRLNPWSQNLFNAENIDRRIGHSWDIAEELTTGRFECIIHDPPMMNMAGELYSADFYAELYRLLGRKGRLFHYIGNPDSRSGANVTRGVIHRLKEVGFKRVSARPQAFGVLAKK